MSTTSARLPLNPILLALLAIGASCFSKSATSQVDLPSSPTHQSSSSHTISRNQLLSSPKALEKVSRAREFLLKGLVDKAQAEISKALHESPECAAALYVQGAIYLRTHDFDRAAAEFQRAIDVDPTMGQAYVGIGMILISRSRFKDALVPLDRAQALLPQSWLVYFETAIANLQLGEYRTALKQLGNADGLAGNDSERKSGTAYLRGLALICLRDYKSATESMQDAIRFEPSGSYAKPAQGKIEEMRPFLEFGGRSLAINNRP